MGTHPIFESDFDCLTEMDENLKKFLIDVMSLSDEVVAICNKLGAMRSILAFSNLDRMRANIVKDANFEKLSVIDADQILWVRHSLSKYVRYEKVLPSGGIDELMDLRETWVKSEDKAENEQLVKKLNDKIADLENAIVARNAEDEDMKKKLEVALKINEEMKEQLSTTIKELKMKNAEKSGEIYTFKERLKETESNNAELRKVLKKFNNGNGTLRLTRTPFAYANDNRSNT